MPEPDAPAGAAYHPAVSPAHPDRHRRRVLATYFTSVALTSTGYIATFTVASLAAPQLTGSRATSGLPSAVAVAGTAVAAAILSALMARRGRRAGIVTGLAIGSLGALAGLAVDVRGLVRAAAGGLAGHRLRELGDPADSLRRRRPVAERTGIGPEPGGVGEHGRRGGRSEPGGAGGVARAEPGLGSAGRRPGAGARIRAGRVGGGHAWARAPPSLPSDLREGDAAPRRRRR